MGGLRLQLLARILRWGATCSRRSHHDKGHNSSVPCLLDHGADADHDGEPGAWTPLLAAATAGFEQACRQLLDHGANLHLAKQALNIASERCCGLDAALRLLDKMASERTGSTNA